MVDVFVDVIGQLGRTNGQLFVCGLFCAGGGGGSGRSDLLGGILIFGAVRARARSRMGFVRAPGVTPGISRRYGAVCLGWRKGAAAFPFGANNPERIDRSSGWIVMTRAGTRARPGLGMLVLLAVADLLLEPDQTVLCRGLDTDIGLAHAKVFDRLNGFIVLVLAFRPSVCARMRYPYGREGGFDPAARYRDA